MSKVLKTVATIAGAVALVATGVGAVAGGPLLATATTVATYAGLAAGGANIGAQLTAKPPPARGSVTQVLIAADAPQPYVMGEGYFAGVLRHDVAYGATLKKVPNPYRWLVTVYSGGGPVQSITPYVDLGAVPGWYSGFLSTDTQLGTCPESTALVPPFGTATGWTSASKLSGQAAIGWNLKFDKDGERFASGIPQLGAYGQWVKAYDPRLDSTFPGGSGAHRLGNEATYTWTQNPALHAGTYAYGRFQNGKRTFGVGLPAAAIDWSGLAAWANVCDANGWTIFGVVYEPMPETRWPNLKDICAAGGCKPIFAAGLLTFYFAAPRVVLDTFTEADFGAGNGSVTAMQPKRRRPNTVVPKYRSASHNWELVASETAVSSSVYVTADGEERKVEWPFNLVKDGAQAAELAAYELADSRELQPIGPLTYGDRVKAYKPGECVHLDHPSLALDHDAVILTRDFNPATMETTFTFISETASKHPWALGQTSTPPPIPSLKQTSQQRDEQAAAAQRPFGWQLSVIRAARVRNPRTTGNVPRKLLTASDIGSTATISVARQDWDYPDSEAVVTRELGSIAGLAFDTQYFIYFDDDTLANGAPTYLATTDEQLAQNSSSFPARHYLGGIRTPANGAADTASDGVFGTLWDVSATAGMVEDFYSANNQNAAPLVAPTIPGGGTAINHSGNIDGSVDLTFEWLFSGDEAEIDGFDGLLYSQVSGAAYTIGSDPQSELVTPLEPFKRVLVFKGIPASLNYTLAVRTRRVVDRNIDPSGRLYSAWVKSTASGEDPYQPSVEVPFTGLLGPIGSGVSATTVAATVDGTTGKIASAKVVESSIAAGAINLAGYARLAGTLYLSASTSNYDLMESGSETTCVNGEMVVISTLLSIELGLAGSAGTVHAVTITPMAWKSGGVLKSFGPAMTYSVPRISSETTTGKRLIPVRGTVTINQGDGVYSSGVRITTDANTSATFYPDCQFDLDNPKAAM